MRIIVMILLIVSIKIASIQACDICGCGVGGYYSGIQPQYHKHFIGLRWRFSSFKSDLGHDGENITAYSKEHYHSLELMGRFYPHRRVQLLVFVPLNYHFRATPSQSYELLGLGDIVVMALYNIYNTSFLAEKTVKHNLLVGGGVKAPTGYFEHKDEQGELLTPNFQPGTGSVDFLLTSLYTLRYKRWGVNGNVTYKINLPNKHEYKFGNQLNIALVAFYLHKPEKKEWGFMPKFGLALEHANYNLKNGYKRINTGGNQLVASVGLDVFYRKIQLGIDYQQPTWQDLSSGLVEAGPRFMASINYLF